MNEHVKTAFEELRDKGETYSELWDYYDGSHPLVYSTKRLQSVFQKIDARFSENWCSVVVDSVADKLKLQGIQAGNTQQSGALAALWNSTGMALDMPDVLLAALVTGEAFVIAWPNGAGSVEAYYNDPRMCHVVYDPDNPRRKAFAAKWYQGLDGRYRMTLYYPETLQYYRAKSKDIPSEPTAFQLEDEKANPYGEIPVFHFRTERRTVKSVLANAIQPQIAINKLFADMMVAAEFGAFKQRYVISQIDDLTALKNAPNEIWNIPSGDGDGQATSVGEFSTTDLDNYIKAMRAIAGDLSTITKTPKHFFFQQGGSPSGEALIAMEAPLNDRAKMYIERFTPTLQDLGRFMLKLSGQTVDDSEISVIWDNPETVQPRTKAEIQQIRVQTGEPLTYVMRDQGASEADVNAMLKAKKDEAAAANSNLAQALLDAQRKMDQNGANE